MLQAALGLTIAIVWSLVVPSWWNPLFAVAGIGCFAFAVEIPAGAPHR
jgi:hypothetical protein